MVGGTDGVAISRIQLSTSFSSVGSTVGGPSPAGSAADLDVGLPMSARRLENRIWPVGVTV